MQLLHIYVPHARTIVPARRETIIETCRKIEDRLRVRVNFVDAHEPDELSADTLRQSVNLEKTGDERFDPLMSDLHRRNISNTLKHCVCLKHIATQPDDEQNTYLVIEDDVVCGADFVKALEVLCTSGEHRASSDIVFLGLPRPSTSEKGPLSVAGGLQIYDFRETFNVLPSCESYLVRPAAAAKLLHGMLPVRFRTNVQLAYAITQHPDVRAGFSHPTVFVDGSKLGASLSSVEVNNDLMYSPQFATLEQMLKADEPLDDAELEALSKTITTKHPDILSRLARLQHRAGHLEEAKRLFRDAYSEIKAGNGVLNGRSQFLKAYIDLYRDLV